MILDGASGVTRHTTEVAVVGSGPAGSAAARALALGGKSVLVIEEGPLRRPTDFHADAFSAMADMYRDLGGTLTRSRAPMPLLAGRVVGGGSPINGAICWRLPEDVYAGWVERDPSVAEALPWQTYRAIEAEMEARLGVAPTDPSVAGPNNLLLKAGADALGLESRPIRRNVIGCQGLGRCLQGCPIGAKQSVDRTLLPDAFAHGARLLHSTRVTRITPSAFGVRLEARAPDGARVEIDADRVVLAAGALQTPVLLLQSGLNQGPVGRHFQCHPGAAVAGVFADPVRVWRGATQGHEVTGLRREGIKFEALGYDLTVAATRVSGVGASFSQGLEGLAREAHWGAAVRAQAEGRVTVSRGRPKVRFTPNALDLTRVRRGVAVLARLLFAAGAQAVMPGVSGALASVKSAGWADAFEANGTLDLKRYSLAATHLFGTCRLGGSARDAVVRPDFVLHQSPRVSVVDASVFPSNTGVNPQTSIIAIATLAGQRMAASA